MSCCIPVRLALRDFAITSGVLALVIVGACHSNAPDGRAEQSCVDICVARASARCSEDACIRGCKFALDRLLEHEGANVVSCIARGHGACDDKAWAECSVTVGIHADGGPPAPSAPRDDEE